MKIVIFHALEEEQVKGIAALLLKNMDRRLTDTARISLTWDPGSFRETGRAGI